VMYAHREIIFRIPVSPVPLIPRKDRIKYSSRLYLDVQRDIQYH